MARLLSILLIPFFVLGPALPHSHAGSGIVAPDSHGPRPHMHFHGHYHHTHGQSNAHHPDDDVSVDSVLDSSDEHDSDAVYVASSDHLLSRAVGKQRIDLGSNAVGFQVRFLPSRFGCRFQN